MPKLVAAVVLLTVVGLNLAMLHLVGAEAAFASSFATVGCAVAIAFLNGSSSKN